MRCAICFTVTQYRTQCPYQLPYRVGVSSNNTHLNQAQTSASLIQISRYRFSLVIQGLTKHLQRVNELVGGYTAYRTLHI